jgi:hypothetical protein
MSDAIHRTRKPEIEDIDAIYGEHVFSAIPDHFSNS